MTALSPAVLAKGRYVWLLAIGQMFSYAGQFFAFPSLVLFWSADLGWEKSTLALGPMLALLMAAALAPLVGRLVDRGHGAGLMVGGVLLGAVALVAMTQVTTPLQWMAAWMVSGIGQAASQYEVCFAFLIRRLGEDARPGIVRITLAGGFAGFIAFPSYAFLATHGGWRLAMLMAAAVLVLVVAPLNHHAINAIRRLAPPPRPRPAALGARAMTRSRWLMAASFALVSLNHWMIAQLLVPIFVEQGHSLERAVLIASLFGPALVLGRFALMFTENRIGNLAATLLMMGVMVAASGLLILSGAGLVVALAYVALQGVAFGSLTILRPLLIADLVGAENFGASAGAIQLPAMMAGAVAPLLGSLMLEGPGLPVLMGLSVTFTLLAVTLLALVQRSMTPPPAQSRHSA